MSKLTFNTPDFLIAEEALRQAAKDGVVLDHADATMLARVVARDTAGIDFEDFVEAIDRAFDAIRAFH